MAVKKRRAWSNLSWNIKVKPEHWRDPCEEYVGQRQHNPVWRSKCRLPEGASLTDKRTIERYIEPQARLDLVSYVAGTGPHPRLPPPAPKTPERAADLVTEWYAERPAPGDGSRPIASTYTYDSRVRLARLILGERPATDLLSRQITPSAVRLVPGACRSRDGGRQLTARFERERASGPNKPGLLVIV